MASSDLNDFPMFDQDTERGEQEENVVLSIQRPKAQYMPIDFVNQQFWGSGNMGLATGSVLSIEAGRKGKRQSVVVRLDFDQDDLKACGVQFSHPLTPYGQRLYLACDSMLESGNHDVTASSLFYCIGGRGKPKPNDRKKILDELRKLRYVNLSIDNQPEIDAGFNYQHYKYEGALIPSEFIVKQARTNGGIVEGFIHFYRPHLALTEFSRGRNQGKTFPANVFRTPNKMTDRIIALENYLLYRIASTSISAEILWTTIYEKCCLKPGDRKARQRLREYAVRALDFWSSDDCKILEGYEMFETGEGHSGPGISIIQLPKKPRP